MHSSVRSKDSQAKTGIVQGGLSPSCTLVIHVDGYEEERSEESVDPIDLTDDVNWMRDTVSPWGRRGKRTCDSKRWEQECSSECNGDTMTDVLVSRKRSTFDHNFEDHTYDRLMDRYDDDELQRICESHERHYDTLSQVGCLIEDRDAAYETVVADLASPDMYRDRDLVVSVGGDGTMLETAKYIEDDTPVIGIKSDSNSVGGLCTYGMDEVQTALDDAFNGPKIERWPRIRGEHEHGTDIALNEIFVGVKETDSAYYTIEHNGTEERQQSSGIIISTGAGSTGWYKNIDETPILGTKPFDNTAEELRYAVREPMDASLSRWLLGKTPIHDETERYTFRTGTVEPGDTFRIHSHMNDDREGIVRYDGDKRDRTYDFSRGKTVELGIADQPLHVVTGSDV